MNQTAKTRLLVGLVATIMAPCTAFAGKLAVLPIQLDKSAAGQVPALFDDVVLTAVQNVTRDDVIGAEDINAMLGFEKQKDLLGCSDATCLANIGGALGVDRLLILRVARVGEEWVTTAKILNIVSAEVEARSSEFVRGDIKDLFRATPGIIARLLRGGGAVRMSVPAVTTPAPPVAPAPAPEPEPPAPGAIEITSEPAGAKCKIEGEPAGETPCLVDELPVGSYSIELTAENYETVSSSASVTAGKTTELAFTLRLAPVEVSFEGVPPDATASIAGEPVEMKGRSLALRPGSYDLLLVKDDYIDLAVPLVVEAGKAQILKLQMEPGYSSSQLSSRRARLVSGIVFASLAAVGGGLFAWQGSEAAGTVGRLQALPPGDADLDRLLNGGQTSIMIADVALISGSVCFAIAGTLLGSLLF